MGRIVKEFYSSRYPSKWRVFDKNALKIPLTAFGLQGDVADVNRWAARYRAAASFDELKLVEYQSQGTVEGYSALVRSVLVWSAFERYLRLIGLDQPHAGELLAPFDPEAVAEKVRALDVEGRLYTYIRSKVTNPTLGAELDKFADGDACNATYLLSAIRHIFGHGHLTPGSNETPAEVTRDVCNTLCDFHLHVMDSDFSQRMQDFEEMLTA